VDHGNKHKQNASFQRTTTCFHATLSSILTMNHVPVASTSNVISCRWDWCRSTLSDLDALETHVKHTHIWPMKPMSKADIALLRRLDLQSSSNTDSTSFSGGGYLILLYLDGKLSRMAYLQDLTLFSARMIGMVWELESRRHPKSTIQKIQRSARLSSCLHLL
jgi:hypothetical protein